MYKSKNLDLYSHEYRNFRKSVVASQKSDGAMAKNQRDEK